MMRHPISSVLTTFVEKLLERGCSPCAAPTAIRPAREWWCGPVTAPTLGYPDPYRVYLGFPTDDDPDQRWIQVKEIDGAPLLITYLDPPARP